jgi:hypothetical protein
MRWLALVLALAGCDRLFGITEIPFAGGDGGSTGGAMLQVSDPMVDFGQVEDGKQSTTQTYNVINVGTAATAALNVTSSGDASQFTFDPGTCKSAVLAPGTGCFVMLTFAPTTAGSFSATFEFQDASTAASLVASGIGLVPGVLGLGNVPMFTTEPVGTSAPSQTVMVTNGGSMAVTIETIGVSGTGSGSYAVLPGGTCQPNVMLAGGATCTINVGFTPKIGGSPPASLVLTDNAPTGGTSVASLSGTGTSTISVSKQGTGTGVVISGDQMIQCGSLCSETVATSSVVLSGTPDPLNTLAPWPPNCQPMGASCVVPTTAGIIDVAATFMAYPKLSVMITGSMGSVTSSVGGIDCSFGSAAMCSAQLAPNTAVTLTETPMNDVFNTWSGACAAGSATNAATCALKLTADVSVTADFESGGTVLNLEPAATNPPLDTGVSVKVNNGPCPHLDTGCSYPTSAGLTMNIQAAGDTCFLFSGFSSNCTPSGSNACTIITAPGTNTVSYTFTRNPNGSGACAGSAL